jgi:hydroxyacylglutathione hydrolase
MDITLQSFTFNEFQENTYVISDGDRNCIIVDPGCYDRLEQKVLTDYIADNQLLPLALLCTHGHIDHVLGNDFVRTTYDIPFILHVDEFVTWQSVENYAHVYGFHAYKPCEEPSQLIQGNENLTFGAIRLKVFHTPGHSPGHVVFYDERNKFVLNGDVLFKGSFGRVDLPGGNLETLKRSIHETMFSLPDDTIVYCGHGEPTTIGEEKRSNYILQF